MPTTEQDERADPALRPRPQLTFDTVWWHEALKKHKLLIQRCMGCSRLRHPVQPMCPACRSLTWDTVQACGRGTVYSYVISHFPKFPGFDYPLAIALVDLEEGTRVIANIVGCAAAEVSIGMDVELEFLDLDEDRAFPQFHPADRKEPSS